MARRSNAARRYSNSGNSATPWLIGGGVLLVAAGVVAAIVLSRGPKEPVAGKGGEPEPKGGEPRPGDGTPDPKGGKPKLEDVIPGIVPKADKPVLTREKFSKLHAGMKKEEIAAISGPGRAVNEQEVSRAFEAASGADGTSRFAHARSAGARSWEQRGSGGDSLYVGYGQTSRGDRVVYFMWFSTGPAGVMMSPGGLLPFEAGNLESAAANWDKEQAVLNDPKWKVGAEARAALVGRWLNSSNTGYEFFADGTHKWLGAGPYTSTYRFRDPQTLELDGYDPFAKLKGRTIPYRVLVAGDEMYLVHGPDAIRPTPAGPYIRQPTEK